MTNIQNIDHFRPKLSHGKKEVLVGDKIKIEYPFWHVDFKIPGV